MPTSFAFPGGFYCYQERKRERPCAQIQLLLKVAWWWRYEGLWDVFMDFILSSQCIQATGNALWPVTVVEAPSKPSSPALARSHT